MLRIPANLAATLLNAPAVLNRVNGWASRNYARTYWHGGTHFNYEFVTRGVGMVIKWRGLRPHLLPTFWVNKLSIGVDGEIKTKDGQPVFIGSKRFVISSDPYWVEIIENQSG